MGEHKVGPGDEPAALSGEMVIERVPLSRLLAFKENPRRITEEDRRKLRKSILRFGLFKPLLIWQAPEGHPDGIAEPIVIGGNQRLHILQAMAQAGELPMEIDLERGTIQIHHERIPCIRFPGSWDEAKVVALRDNTADGEWNLDTLPAYLADLESVFAGVEGWSVDLTGFDQKLQDELAKMASLTEKRHARGEQKERSALDRKVAQVVIGIIRGKIPVAVYNRWSAVFERYSKLLESTHLPTLMENMATDLEAAATRREQALREKV